MKILSSAKPPRRPGAWLLGLLLLALGWLVPATAHATHLRAGDIQAKVDTTPTRNPNRIFFKLTLYRDPTQAQQPNATLYFGDGTNSGPVAKTSEVTLTNNVARLNTSVLTFYFDHTYPGGGIYNVSFVEANRVANVVNMVGSVGQTFYLNTTISTLPGIGFNHLPVLKAPAIDIAAAGQVFLHNPAAFDADGDSLGFRITESRQVINYPSNPPANYTPVPSITTGFQFPNNPSIFVNGPPLTVPFQGAPGGAPATFSIDRNGQLTWNAPVRLGVYNVAIVVEEWRRTALAPAYKIGEVVRDMQINVEATNNLPPIITIPRDTCVVAGSQIIKNVTAVDGNSAASPATAVQLFAYGGMLPSATGSFTQSTQGPPRAVGTFRWTPNCTNVAALPYLVVFKAQDTPRAPDPPLIDEKTWRITVIGPAPTNLQAAPNGSGAILLSWNPYGCQTTSVAGQLPTIRIYRREGCFPYTPSACETGIPAGAGYQLIGSVPANVTAFNDTNGGAGLVRGRTYSYRIYAEFPLPGGGSSIVSNEACITLGGRSAQITNVDVLSTSPTGQISVKWTKPLPSTGTSFNAPLGYRLSRSATGAAPFTLVATKTSLTDTTYVDNVNTQAAQYTYQLVFFSAATNQPGSPETTETAPLASSVRLSLVPNGLTNTNALTWAYQVPWDNTKQPTRIFRRTGTTGAYAQIATVTGGTASGSYTDQDPTLVRGQTYCYYVQTNGQYATPVNSLNQLIYTNLINNSQEQCAALIPTPCTPVLTLAPTNCDSLAGLNLGSNFPLQNQRYQNRLRWTVGNTPTGCSTDIAYFRLFYRTTADGPLALLDSVAGTQFTYLHRNLTNGAGCYAVQAVSPSGVRSAVSNIACQDECVFFILPNIFTPNNDVQGLNEKFRPKTSSPITRTHIQIFNRWGRKVYESDQDPYINWDGGGAYGEAGSATKASDGVYYYLAEVEFADFARTKRTFKGWVEIVR
ncbi:MAG TPA: gliding motility-associated C-terminal domain-containing protein [Hymenobacter sp.]|uniref:T9SS type B sorting domain-containing protein n=1 Tax=Hymenobacter sp. TaxID=1898978 RepID=UPI002D806F3C|nr:gliding motility-associated C-terminal domain-containing protein [Hymenobacter sp.]HET9505848.1 gliding motility-associated C-terminal domain-containing protein [Hymenobacter sp.]